MSFDADDEIFQDFLVEAGEILELLQEQLVELEKNSTDKELLNAIFRGFHTIKGGAGFLNLEPMVELCHQSENLFDLLRSGKLSITSKLMDVILQALDSIVAMYQQTKDKHQQTPADPNLLFELNTFIDSAYELNQEPKQQDIKIDSSASSKDKIEQQTQQANDNEDDELLNDDHMTDDEFEALLDSIHGEHLFSNVSSSNSHESASQELETKIDKKTSTISDDGEIIIPDPEPEKPKTQDAENNETKTNKVSKVQADTSVRVDTHRLDKIMNIAGELVLIRNRLVNLGANLENQDLVKSLMNLDMLTSDLQNAVMKTRMQPIKKLFSKFPRVIRDLARNLNKEIDLVIEGQETDLDKNLVEALADPLVHLIRNSVDHGIESPNVRIAHDKEAKGTITLSAKQKGDHILLQIKDDGQGMDPIKLKALAIKNNVIDKATAENMSDSDAYALIFAAGFSTKRQISNISGRGVGMDVVRNRINELNGTVKIDSELTKGTTISIRVPLTLAIMPTLMVKIADKIFALPLAVVNEIFQLDLSQINLVDGQRVALIRNQSIPIFYLEEWFCLDKKITHTQEKLNHLVIIKKEDCMYGFVVDEFLGQEEVLVKPLGEIIKDTPGISGVTITANGRVAFILDVVSLIKHYTK